MNPCLHNLHGGVRTCLGPSELPRPVHCLCAYCPSRRTPIWTMTPTAQASCGPSASANPETRITIDNCETSPETREASSDDAGAGDSGGSQRRLHSMLGRRSELRARLAALLRPAQAPTEAPDAQTPVAQARPPVAGSARSRVYVLELFSGHGSVSAIASSLLDECQVVTVDESDEHGTPTIKATLPRDNALVVEYCRTRFPGGRPVIWASPDCRHYSRLRTTGARNLEEADAAVRAAQEIAVSLDALVLIIENPATGMLVGREVISFMPFRSEVHYCRYGRLYRKPTMLWFSHDLRKYGFEPRMCQYTCDATYVRHGVKRHLRSVTDYCIGVRISVPDALVACVFTAVASLVRESLPAVDTFDPAAPREARRDDEGVVDSILDCRVMEGGAVELRVSWVGHDHRDWIDAGNLNADIATYDFEDPDVEARCLALLRPRF